jgi:hypothetical protein
VNEEIAFHVRSQLHETRPDWAVSVPLPELTPERIAADVRAAFADLDWKQIEITRRLTAAERLRQISSLNEFLRRAILAAIRAEEPGIAEEELHRRYLKRIGVRVP